MKQLLDEIVDKRERVGEIFGGVILKENWNLKNPQINLSPSLPGPVVDIYHWKWDLDYIFYYLFRYEMVE
jgi:hypothetical protein